MQIVIDIDEDTYKDIKKGKVYSSVRDVPQESVLAIANGTPLPEHHGRLIDADAFQKYCFEKNFDKRLSEGGLATINMFLAFQETIIEADKGSENK